MRRTLIFLGLMSVLVLVPRVGHAQLTDEQKRQMFLKAREDIHPVPRVEPSATPRPKPKSVSTPTPTPRPTPDSTPTPKAREEEPPEKPVRKAAPVEEEEKPAPPAKHPKGDVPLPPKIEEKDLPEEKPDRAKSDVPLPPKVSEEEESKPTPAPLPPVTADKTPVNEPPKAPITIEKSGLEEDQGLEPAPKTTGGWFHRWRYLSPGVRRAIDQAKVQKGRWKYIVVHNSGTRQGNARIFDAYHRNVRKMPNGLAYHFVIGNGSSSGDGQIEIGPRWVKQINGGHVASDYLNNIALGVCLVGDFNRDTPTKAQLAALDELIVYLRGRVGRIKGKPATVFPHKKINPKPTDCPGDRFPYGWLQQKFGS
jgi:N-acetylmuramoyl-L-alanine amidase